MIETFTAEVWVTDHKQNYEPELTRLASGWFQSQVSCIALDVSISAETGRLVARGTYVPQPLPSGSRVEAAARWLGLVRGPSPAPRRL